jgi:hypothetical protein
MMAGRGKGVAVMMLDLDHFKGVNDSTAMPRGTRSCDASAERLRAEMRPGDLLARLGGEEFLVAIDDRYDTAVECAERLRRRIGEAPFASAMAARRSPLRCPSVWPCRTVPGWKRRRAGHRARRCARSTTPSRWAATGSPSPKGVRRLTGPRSAVSVLRLPPGQTPERAFQPVGHQRPFFRAHPPAFRSARRAPAPEAHRRLAGPPSARAAAALSKGFARSACAPP